MSTYHPFSICHQYLERGCLDKLQITSLGYFNAEGMGGTACQLGLKQA